jgi:hypothetical protein
MYCETTIRKKVFGGNCEKVGFLQTRILPLPFRLQKTKSFFQLLFILQFYVTLPGQERKQGSWYRTTGVGQLGQITRDRIYRTGRSEHYSTDRTAGPNVLRTRMLG